MSRSPYLFAPLAFLVMVVPGAIGADDPPAEPTNFVWKFTLDTPFYQKMTTTTEQQIKVQGLDVGQRQEQTFYFKLTPIKHDGDRWQIRQEVEGVQMKIDIAGNPVSADSTLETPAGQKESPLVAFVKAMKGASFTVTLNTKTMKVESVEGRDEFLKKIGAVNSQLKPLLEKILSEDGLKQMADPTFGFVPVGGKKVGDKWESVAKLDLGPLGSYKNQYGYVYKGREKSNADLARIEVLTTVTYAPPAKPDPALPFAIKDGKLSSTSTKPGVLLFNTKTGHLERSQLAVEMSGTLTLEIGGQSTTVDLSQAQKTLVEVGDNSFLPKPKKR